MRSCLFLLGVRGKWVTPTKQDSGILLPKSTQSLGIPPFHPLSPPPSQKKKRKKILSYAIGADWFPCLDWKLGHWSLTFYKCLIKLSLKLTRPFILPLIAQNTKNTILFWNLNTCKINFECFVLQHFALSFESFSTQKAY